MNIEEFLTRWKSKLLFGQCQFKKLNHILVKGQSLSLLAYKAKVSVDGVEKIIEKNRFFQTRAHGLNENDDINPNGDNYVCQQILNQLKRDFFKDYNPFIDVEATKKTGI